MFPSKERIINAGKHQTKPIQNSGSFKKLILTPKIYLNSNY